jgi:hypothetical protein
LLPRLVGAGAAASGFPARQSLSQNAAFFSSSLVNLLLEMKTTAKREDLPRLIEPMLVPPVHPGWSSDARLV